MDNLYKLEAHKIYRSLFHQDVPEIVISRFRGISERLDENISLVDKDQYYHIIRKVDDLEALEIVCRITKKMPLLSRKFQAMVYLAETLPSNQHYFVNDRTNFINAARIVFCSIIWTGYKFIKGIWLTVKMKGEWKSL